MIEKNDKRTLIKIVWIISFVIMWIIFAVRLPGNEFRVKLNDIEKNIVKEEWNEANKSMEELKKIYDKKRLLIQSNNASEVLKNFDFALGQLENSIRAKENSSLEYIGGLKASLNYVMKAFPGP